MTIICWDGSILACDSRMTQDTTITSNNVNKLFKLKEPRPYLDDFILCYALSGIVIDFELIHKMMISDEGFPIYTHTNHECSGILVGKKQVYLLEQRKGVFIALNKSNKLADGSGAYFGLSAMTLGLNAIQAVKHAIKHDTACGGRVRSWKYEI